MATSSIIIIVFRIDCGRVSDRRKILDRADRSYRQTMNRRLAIGLIKTSMNPHCEDQYQREKDQKININTSD